MVPANLGEDDTTKPTKHINNTNKPTFMRQKLTLLLLALLCTVGVWADGTWNITSEDYTTDGWTLMGANTPDGVTALGDYTSSL